MLIKLRHQHKVNFLSGMRRSTARDFRIAEDKLDSSSRSMGGGRKRRRREDEVS